MSKIKWSTRLPIQEGWYWAYEDWGDNAYAIDFVRVEFRLNERPFILSVEHGRCNTFSTWDAWYGPLESPNLPKRIIKNV